jgi:ribosome maturation factor RimP
VEPALEAEGYTLVDLEYRREGSSWVLRLFIDRPEGGVTLDDCQKASRLLGPILDVEDIIESRYFMEVSSPGINRRIRKKADFERFAGTKVKIQLRSPVDGRRKITGIIAGVEGNKVFIQNERAGSRELSRVPLAAINRANLQII